MNEHQKNELTDLLNYEYDNMAGMIILQDGKKIYEQYLHGYTKNSRLHVYSVTKSMLSILIGIAIDQGLLSSLDQPVIDFFPEVHRSKRDPELMNITIKDIMTMRAPYQYEDDQMTYMKYFMSNDFIPFTLKQLGGPKPSSGFRYAALIGPDLLSGILTKVTHQSVLDFAKEVLFQPMDIQVKQSIVFHSAKEQKSFSQSRTMSGWVSDIKGIHSGGWGLTLTCDDLAKLGQLYLNDGVWNNKQLISHNWIQESTTEHNRWKELDRGYGYLWWINDEETPGFIAMGDGGNILYVNREKKVVIASTSKFVPQVKDRIQLIKEEIEPLL